MKRKTRIRIDLATINISFLMNFSAYYSMQGLQSSLNKSIGTQSLCALFISLTVSAMFLPPIFISLIGERRSMSLGTITYSLFTLAAIIMGSGAAILWAALRGYIRVKSVEYSVIDGSDKDAKTTHLFGVFMAFLSASLLIGNVTSSLVFQSIAIEAEGNFSQTNTSVEAEVQKRWNVTERTVVMTSHCGVHNCDYDAQNYSETPETHEQIVTNSPVPYILFGVFASLQAAAALIQLFVLTDLTKVSESKHTKDTGNTMPLIVNDKARKSATAQMIAKQLMATIKLNIFNNTARLLIPITVSVGIVEGFVMGQLTRDWMTCYMGIEYIGYGICVFGIGSIAASYGCGRLSYCISRNTMFLVILILELASGLYLLFWEPNMATDSWIFYVVFTMYGIIYTSRKTLINASYAIFFPNDVDAANSSTTMWGATGAAVAFAISSILCNRVYIIVMLVLALAGTGMFVLAERIRDKSHQKKPEETEVVELEHG